PVDEGRDRDVAPAEGRAVEPDTVAEVALEPAVRARDLARAAGEQPFRLVPGRSPEHPDLHRGPDDRLVVRVAQVLDHTYAGALGRGRRQERRRRPAVLDVFQDHGRVEDPGIAVDERRYLEAWVRRGEVRILPAHEVGQPALEGDTLLGER